MAMIKSFSDIVNAMLRFLYSKRPNVDASPGTFTRDVIIDAPAGELSSLYLDLNRTSSAQSPDLAAVTDLEKLGRNFQVLRNGPTKATGIATFYSFEMPTSPITIARGTTLVSKATGVTNSAQQYVTTQEIVLSAIDFNANTGRYEVNVNICAVLAGTGANIPPGAIAAILTPISGIAGAYNYNAITNGADSESLSIFRARLKRVITGNNAGTADGYYQTVTRNLGVIDARITSSITGIEELRRADVGAVDIYIRGLISTQAPTETYTVPVSSPYEFVVSSQPMDLLVASSFILTGSITGTLTEGVHYTIVQDNGKYAGSIKGVDKFVFTSSGVNKVTSGESITIVYSYNSLVSELQLYMDDSPRKVLGADLLIKNAKPRQILVECTIRVSPGYAVSTVTTDVVNALSIFLDSYTIGEEVQQSDVLAVIANTTGVDDITVPLTTFEESSTTGSLSQDVSGNLIIPANSYAVAGTITVHIRT